MFETRGGSVPPRRATLAEVDRLQEIAATAYGRYVARIGREPAPMTADYVEAVTAGATWVVERDGLLAGFVVVRSRQGHLLLESLAVAPEFHGAGIGVRLLALADERARALRLPEIRLYTNEVMTEVFTFYTAHGYDVTHRTTEDGYRRVYFRKPVSARPQRRE